MARKGAAISKKGVIPIAKPKYTEWITPDGLTRIEGWARDGLTDAQIAAKMGIAASTLYVYQADFPEIMEALKRGKAPVDNEVETKLHDRAVGGIIVKETRIERWKDGKGNITAEHIIEIKKELPPDVTAQIYWLKNRRPDKWRDKREVVADVTDSAMKNVQTIASLINNPEPDIDINDLLGEIEDGQ